MLKLIDIDALTCIGRETWLNEDNECEQPGVDRVEMLRAYFAGSDIKCCFWKCVSTKLAKVCTSLIGCHYD